MATATSGPFVEIGSDAFGPYRWLGDAPVSRLEGARWHRVVRDMLTHPVIKGMLFAVEMMIRQAEWRVEPAEDGGTAAQEIAEFVESCMHDLDLPWEDALASTLLFLPYGHALFEVVYKRRLGPDGEAPSMADDGRIGWATWGWRPPETILEFKRNAAGRLEAIVQDVPRSGRRVEIPIDRCLHFKIGGAASGPHGESILRAAYQDWDGIGKLQQIEAIGIERDLAGLPVAFVPADYFPREGQPAEYKATYDAITQMLANLRWNETAGVVFPKQLDQAGHDLWDFKLVSSGGSRAYDTSTVINRRTAQMTMAILADFIMLGHQNTGSYSLSTDKTKLFETAITAWLDLIADVITHQGVVRLLRLNGMDLRLVPKLVPGSLAEADLTATGQFLTALMPLVNTLAREDQLAIVNHVLAEAGWPEATNTEAADEEPAAAPPTQPPASEPPEPGPPGAVPPGGSAA